MHHSEVFRTTCSKQCPKWTVLALLECEHILSHRALMLHGMPVDTCRFKTTLIPSQKPIARSLLLLSLSSSSFFIQCHHLLHILLKVTRMLACMLQVVRHKISRAPIVKQRRNRAEYTILLVSPWCILTESHLHLRYQGLISLLTLIHLVQSRFNRLGKTFLLPL